MQTALNTNQGIDSESDEVFVEHCSTAIAELSTVKYNATVSEAKYCIFECTDCACVINNYISADNVYTCSAFTSQWVTIL